MVRLRRRHSTRHHASTTRPDPPALISRTDKSSLWPLSEATRRDPAIQTSASHALTSAAAAADRGLSCRSGRLKRSGRVRPPGAGRGPPFRRRRRPVTALSPARRPSTAVRFDSTSPDICPLSVPRSPASSKQNHRGHLSLVRVRATGPSLQDH